MTDLFHGGAPGRVVGDLILPPATTGVRTTADFFDDQVKAGRIQGPAVAHLDVSGVYRRDRVYVCDTEDWARSFAQHWLPPDAPLGTDVSEVPLGSVYRVTPDDCPLEKDPDDDPVAPMGWWCAERFVVVEVVDAAVARQSREEFEAGYQRELRRQNLAVIAVPDPKERWAHLPKMSVPKGRRRSR